jgi:hypothetical protein
MLPAGSHQLAMVITAALLVFSDPSSLQNDLIRYAVIVIGWDLVTTVIKAVGQWYSPAATITDAKARIP